MVVWTMRSEGSYGCCVVCDGEMALHDGDACVYSNVNGVSLNQSAPEREKCWIIT